jgi:hypothetical protein
MPRSQDSNDAPLKSNNPGLFNYSLSFLVIVCILFLDYFFLFSGYDDDLLIPIMLSFVVNNGQLSLLDFAHGHFSYSACFGQFRFEQFIFGQDLLFLFPLSQDKLLVTKFHFDFCLLKFGNNLKFKMRFLKLTNSVGLDLRLVQVDLLFKVLKFQFGLGQLLNTSIPMEAPRC